ncbi:MAG: tRNA (guanosine(37)-N1)-methyltransferase TrmD [Patescibacteria group bacterium]
MTTKTSVTFHIVTLFPQAFDSYLAESILKRAIEDKKIVVKFYNPRDFAVQPKNRKQTYAERRVDDKPYGGGPGMVIEALPVIKAIDKAIGRKMKGATKPAFIWLTPSGAQFTTEVAHDISVTARDIVIVCGRYEGIDARVQEVFPFQEISVGPFVLTGGELPAMILIDCIARQVPGVLGNFDSREEARNASPDVYTRPEVFTYKKKKYQVPPVLLSGHQAKIEEWKKAQLAKRRA